MAILPQHPNKITKLMENLVLESSDVKRGYLGMSSIGNKCARALYYGFHWASAPEVLSLRTKRIFQRGDLEEQRVIEDLVIAGMFVFRVENGVEIPHTGVEGEDQEELVGFAGHAKGHPDGRVRGVPDVPDEDVLLEVKTAKASKFKEFVKCQNLKKAHPVYYGQAQRYMAKMGLKYTLFIVTNKDTEERYYEIVAFNEDDANQLQQKEFMIITSTEPPEKISNNKRWLDCTWCRHNDICHSRETPQVNCRTCVYSDIEDDGVWSCSNAYNPKPLSISDQLAGCKLYEKGWGL